MGKPHKFDESMTRRETSVTEQKHLTGNELYRETQDYWRDKDCCLT